MAESVKRTASSKFTFLTDDNLDPDGPRRAAPDPEGQPDRLGPELQAILAKIRAGKQFVDQRDEATIATDYSGGATSIFGGTALIAYCDFNAWSYIAQGGAYFRYGLPTWVGGRAFFARSQSDKDARLLNKQVREMLSRPKE